MSAPSTPYDEVADWYQHDVLVEQRSLGVDRLADRLGICGGEAVSELSTPQFDTST